MKEIPMANTVQDVMTRSPRQVNLDEPLVAVARMMRDDDIGDVLVTDGDTVRGIVTDRDIVVRAVAEGLDATRETVDAVYSGDVTTVTPDTPIEEAVRI